MRGLRVPKEVALMLDAFTWYRQSALKWKGRGLTVHIDPWGTPEGDDPADLLLITHAHFDHFQPDEIARLSKTGTVLVAPHDIASQLSGDVRAIRPGETIEGAGLEIHAVPAYNARPERLEMHPRDNNWVGFVLDLGGTRTYLAGDTDHIPEMADIRTDLAFVPVGGTYTMDVAEATGAIQAIDPKTGVPYHFGLVVLSRSHCRPFVKAIGPI